MKQLSRSRLEAACRAGFQRKYLSRFADLLCRGRIECATTVLARSRAVKLAADLSLAMTAKGRTRWSRAMMAKYIFRLRKTRCKPQGVKSHGKRRSALDKTSPCKPTVACRRSVRCLLSASSSGWSRLRLCHNCVEEAGGTVALSGCNHFSAVLTLQDSKINQ